MKILIEEFEYQDPQILAFLKEVDSTRNKGKVPFVGYMFSKSLKDCVFFLPKVILDEGGKAFKKYDPNVLWNISQEQLSEEERQFLNSFPIWTYQAINIYNRRNPKNIIVRYRKLSNSEVSDDSAHVPFLENIIEIIKFAQENKSFLLFKMQHMHSGQGKVNWTKTISSQQPFLKKGKAPVYLNPVVKKKYVDYEEELLVIFFSILRYINSQYGFSANINLNFELIPKERFNDYLNGEGTRRLHEIRYRYFSDRTLRIWRLCYAFFSRNDRINSSRTYEEYLLASDFDRVFEAMVDDLIGNTLPKHIKKEQEDGKEIDHLFLFNSLVDASLNTYYIADSKYYKIGHRPEGSALFKQYTYARNLIQERLVHKDKENELALCRDDKTEGYNIIPNFFLSAYIDDKFNNLRDPIIYQKSENQSVCHFPNRLFDRETLLLSQYDIDFMYVINQYASNGSKERFREEIHQTFRDNILTRLNEEYLFHVLVLRNKPKQGEERQALKKALDPIFRLVNGKVFCPKKDASYTNLILALENPEQHVTASKKELENENLNVLVALDKDFIIHKGFKIGDSIEDFLTKVSHLC